MNIKMTTHNYQQLKLKNKNKNKKLSKQPEQEQNHRYGDYLEGDQLGGGREKMGEKVQGLKGINGRYKINKGMLRIAWKWRSQRTYYMHDPLT